MATIDHTPPAGFSRLSYAVSSLTTKLVCWNTARQTRIALSQLSERELDDIGLTREDIYRLS